MTRKKVKISFAINLVSAVFGIIGTFMCAGQGIVFFEYYTQDSNVLGIISSIIYCIGCAAVLAGKKEQIPMWMTILRYMATGMLFLTFLVVIFVLTPMYGGFGFLGFMLFSGAMKFFHFLCPVLSFISFVFFEHEHTLRKKQVGWAILPTILYAVIFAILNILKLVMGPYPFFFVYLQPVYMSVIWFVVIVGGAALLDALIMLLHNRAKMKAS